MLIENNQIILKKFLRKNITNEYLSWLNNPDNTKYSRLKNQKIKKNAAVNYFNDIEEKKNLFFMIFLKKLNMKIGTVTVIRKKKKVGNIGILVGNNDYHNLGISTKVIKLLVGYLKVEKKFNFLEIGTNLAHKAMIKVAYKCKFQLHNKNKKYIYFKKKII